MFSLPDRHGLLASTEEAEKHPLGGLVSPSWLVGFGGRDDLCVSATKLEAQDPP
jgi:hypothetical protein